MVDCSPESSYLSLSPSLEITNHAPTRKRSQLEVVYYEFGFDTGHRVGAYIARRNTKLATQQKLGIWT